ncbi:uncharacterized protein LOC112683874 [Sipha flava]|uniref:Uncharacterized protein LOC112683874 n=1 Tax=Sipha flava TaxID=143950 RepID=A0A8B8FJJ2_9HEMI|nr:uncharacterized protein LOC112683874 [Sipha flava]
MHTAINKFSITVALASVLCTEDCELREILTPVISATESTNIPTTSLNANNLSLKLLNELLEQESNKFFTESENKNKLNIGSTNDSVENSEVDQSSNEFFVIKLLITTLTSENFKALTEELLFNITTVSHLEKTIQLIIEMVFCKPQSIPIYVFICSKLENIEKSYDCRFHTATFPVTTLFSRYNFSKLTNLRLLEEL